MDKIQNTSIKHNKKLVIYISMGFGNPYGEEWNTDIVQKWVDKLHHSIGVEIIALSDTIGSASIGDVSLLFDSLIDSYTAVSFGAHFHARPEKVYHLIEAAYNSGCRRFDSAIKGLGGCPMAKDDLTGNVPTELMLAWFNQQGIETNIQMDHFNYATQIATEIFPIH